MKKLLLTLLLLISAFSIQAQTPYAIWCEDNTTLYFTADGNTYAEGDTYDGQTITNVWNGNYIANSGDNAPAWNETVKSTVTNVVFDSSFADVSPTSLNEWFDSCTNLTSINGLEYLNTSNVTNMHNLFGNCSSLTSLYVGNFDTSNVTNMQGMFYKCSGLTNINVTSFNTSNVTNMQGVFDGCSNLISLDVSSFDTSNVTNMAWMFHDCSKLTNLDIRHFNTSNVTNMSGLFFNCRNLANLDVSNFDTSKVTDMANMFDYCWNLTSLDVNNFNVSKVTTMNYMFSSCYGLRTIYCDNDWSVLTPSNVTSLHMFGACSRLVGDTGFSYNTLYRTVDYAHPGTNGYFTSLNYNQRPYAIWCADNTTLHFTADGNSYSAGDTYNGQTITNVWSGTDITYSGNSAPKWNGTVNSTVTNVVFDSSFASVGPTSLHDWFANCQQLSSITGLEYLNTSYVTDMQGMFFVCRQLTNIDVSHFDTSNVTTIKDMFSSCESAANLDVSHFDTSNVTNMQGVFYYCQNLTSLDVTGWDTSNVTNLSYMFYDCPGLTNLDVSSFDTSNVTDMHKMFEGCSNLTTIYCNDIWSCDNSTDMFSGCTSLVGAISFDSSMIDATYAKPVTGYFTLTQQTLNLSEIPTMVYGDGDYELPTTTDQGQTITWTSDNATVATIEGNTLTIKGAGTAIITAAQEGGTGIPSFTKEYNLTVSKAELTVRAVSCTKVEGDANPQFTFTYSGFKYDDNESSVTTPPTLSTTATESSPAGTYLINAEGAEADNYTFNYISGALTVMPRQTVSVTEIPAMTYGDGDYTLPELTEQGHSLTWESDDTGVVEVSGNTLTITGAGTASVTASQTGGSTETTDILNSEQIGSLGSSGYALYEGITSVSGAVYTAQCGGRYDAIQLRSNNNNCGIVTTASGGKAASMTINWNDNTDGSRVLLVYGSHTPYTNPTDLYGSGKGELIAEVAAGTGEVDLGSEFEYIGLRSKSGLIYLADVNIVWSEPYAPLSQTFTVTVAKAPLTITADDKTKYEGDENPELTVSFSGFVNGEDATALTTQPTVTTTATTDSPVGTYPITASGAESDNYEFTYVDGTLTVERMPLEDTDISLLDNVVYIENFDVSAGGQYEIAIQMKNSANIRGFQFSLFLPEGVTAAKTNKGKIRASLNQDRLDEEDEHSLTISEHEDGSLLFLCSSQYDENFLGNDGDVVYLIVNVSEDMEDGDYPVLLKNIKLSETDISVFYETALVKSTMTVSSYMLGDINGDGVVDLSDYIGVANHIHSIPQTIFIEKAGDVDQNNIIDLSDYIGVANIIHYGSIYGNSSTLVKPRNNMELDPQ